MPCRAKADINCKLLPRDRKVYRRHSAWTQHSIGVIRWYYCDGIILLLRSVTTRATTIEEIVGGNLLSKGKLSRLTFKKIAFLPYINIQMIISESSTWFYEHNNLLCKSICKWTTFWKLIPSKLYTVKFCSPKKGTSGTWSYIHFCLSCIPQEMKPSIASANPKHDHPPKNESGLS